MFVIVDSENTSGLFGGSNHQNASRLSVDTSDQFQGVKCQVTVEVIARWFEYILHGGKKDHSNQDLL